MSGPRSVRLAAASPQFVQGATATELVDWHEYFEPDAVLLAGTADDGTTTTRRAMDTLRRHTDPELPRFAGSDGTGASGPRRIDGVQFVFAPSTEALASVEAAEGEALDTGEPTFVVGDLLGLSVDTTALSASLLGREAYVDALDPDRLEGEYVHLSTRLPAGYRRTWDGLTVVGAGADAGIAGTPLVALGCRADGRVLTRDLEPSRLGLRALDGVGATRAGRLREAGFRDRAAVAEADLSRLADVAGLGGATAERIRDSALAMADGEVVRRSNGSLPAGDPVFVDIETDGLSPTITWLIGVLDGADTGDPAADGSYQSFLTTDPDQPGRAIADFMSWYTAEASGQPLVAYNGWGFDFDVLSEHIREYCPRYAEDWERTDRFDPYRWATEEGNAALPGRTNRLDDVAGALGYERAGDGLTGAAVARTYRRWMEATASAAEPDWDRFDSYCEDDVRALATVYGALADSSRIAATDDSRDVTDSTTQGTLSEW
jgi:uncharacterized protein YprB with RNaseH-like and TPR domain